MDREYFTKEEADAKVCRRVRTRVEFSGVPEGTTGRVIRADEAGAGYDLGIQWDLPTEPPAITTEKIGGEPVTIVQTGKPLVDWFSKDEYEKFLVEEDT